MTLLETIKADQLIARKTKATLSADLLTTLYAEAAKVGKDKGNRESTDEEVIAVIQKFLKNNKESQVVVKGKDLDDLKAEELVLVSYLPTQLSEADVRAELAQLKTLGVVDLKSVMAHFKTRFAGRYDGGLVSRLAKENSG